MTILHTIYFCIAIWDELTTRFQNKCSIRYIGGTATFLNGVAGGGVGASYEYLSNQASCPENYASIQLMWVGVSTQ